MKCSIGAHIIILALSVFVMPWLATAQRPAHIPRIAFLELNPPPAASEPTPFLDEFRQELRARNWVKGHTIAIEWRWAAGSLERFATPGGRGDPAPSGGHRRPECDDRPGGQGGHRHNPHRGERRWLLSGAWARGQPGTTGWERDGNRLPLSRRSVRNSWSSSRRRSRGSHGGSAPGSCSQPVHLTRDGGGRPSRWG